MNNFFNLVKVNLISDFKLNKMFKWAKQNSKFKIPLVVVGSLLFLTMAMGIVLGYFYVFAEMFYQADAIHLILLLGISIASFFSLLATVFKVNGYLFGARDFDLLMSMPIKSTTIISAKLFGLYLINALTFAVIYFPAVILYFYFGGFAVLPFLLSIIIFLIAPLFPIALSGFLGYFAGFFIYKFKYKQLLTIVSSLLFVVVIIFFSFSMPNAGDAEVVVFFEERFKNIYYLAIFAVGAIGGDLISFLIFAGVSLIPSFLFVLLVSKNFVAANDRSRRVYRNKKYIYVSKAPNSIRASLIKKEFKRYFTLPIYLLNTIVGPIMSTILIVLFLSSSKELLDSGLIEKDFLYLIMIAISILTYGMISTTASSISLEGKYFWIMKSLPIPTKDVFFSKMAVNVGICLPFIFINTIAASIFLGFNPIGFTFLLLIPILLIVFISAVGLIINLRLPKFDWDTPVKVVKQSASVLVAMITGFALTALFIITGYLLIIAGIEILFVYLIGTALAIGLNIVALVILFTRGKIRYDNLKA